MPGANNRFFVYGQKGEIVNVLVTTQGGAEFTLTNKKALILDLADSQFKVIDTGTVGNYITLLSFTGFSSKGIWAVDGLFKPYYDGFVNGALDILTYWNKKDKLLIKDNLSQNCDFKALFFSDIHGNSTELQRIIALGNDWQSGLDTIVDGGDDTQLWNTGEGTLDWFNTLAATSDLPIVRAAGNHDAWTGDFVWATVQQIYEYFTAPAVLALTAKGVTVIQPSDAATAYRNYYYVDFGNLRIIVLLSLTIGNTNRFYDADQDTWFKAVLADAKTNNKSVICVNHGPLNPSSCDEIECNWTSYKSWNTIADNQHVDDDAVLAVDEFIDNGGQFVCWLSGHTHVDYILQSNIGTHRQFCFTTSCAKSGNTVDGVKPTETYNQFYDLFNLIGIDLTNKLIKLWRIGFNTNKYLQEHNTLVWDYKNEKIVSDN